MAGSGPSLCQELGAKHSGQPKTGSEPSRGSGLPWLPPALTSVLGLLLVSQNASKSADASNSAEFLCEKQSSSVNQGSIYLWISVPGKVKVLYEKSMLKARINILQACISKLLLL